jgi:hypothetical protein
MLSSTLGWELTRLRNGIRSDASLWFIAVAPAALLPPLDAAAFFESWLQAAGVFGWLYAFLIASKFGGDAGLLHESSVWLFQKGHSLVDYSLARLFIAAAASFMAILYAAVWFAIGAAFRSQYTVRQHAAWTLTLGGVTAVSLAVLFFAGAARTKRSTDFLIVVALLSMIQDLLTANLPAAAAAVIVAVLPPFKAAHQFAGAMLTSGYAEAMLAALHILAFCAVCVVASGWLQSRWRPRLISSA